MADIVVVAMTSNPGPTDYGFIISSADLEMGQLNRPGIVRVDKIYTLAQTIVAKRFGRVKPVVLNRIRTLLADIIATKS